MSEVTRRAWERGHRHYAGVSLLNTALMRRAQGEAEDVVAIADEALSALSHGSANWESLSAALARAWASAHLGRIQEARDRLNAAIPQLSRASRAEWLVEACEIELHYGDEAAATALLDEAATANLNPSLSAISTMTRVQLALRMGDIAAAIAALPQTEPRVPTQEPGHHSRYLAVRAQISVMEGAADARDRVRDAMLFASEQGARIWAGFCQVLGAATSEDFDAGIQRAGQLGGVYLSLVAEVIVERLHLLAEDTLEQVTSETELRPERWRDSVRRVVVDERHPSRPRAARILDRIGDPSDVPLLRAIVRSTRKAGFDSGLGRGLARRLATAVYVEDLGRVEVVVGSRTIPGTDLRRKVLAMLCYLLTRPRFAATRDEIVDALWPELGPDVAVNSLNQTVYFLRRVFEPGYKEDIPRGTYTMTVTSCGSIPTLSDRGANRAETSSNPMGSKASPTDTDVLSSMYTGKFALDFSYEEWAVPFRDSLHVATCS